MICYEKCAERYPLLPAKARRCMRTITLLLLQKIVATVFELRQFRFPWFPGLAVLSQQRFQLLPLLRLDERRLLD